MSPSRPPLRLKAPVSGAVIAIEVVAGQRVASGQTLLLLEAMKMEHSLAAPVSGRAEVLVSVGDQVKVDQVLARLTPDAETDAGKPAVKEDGT